jgi:hypothetical protein
MPEWQRCSDLPSDHPATSHPARDHHRPPVARPHPPLPIRLTPALGAIRLVKIGVSASTGTSSPASRGSMLPFAGAPAEQVFSSRIVRGMRHCHARTIGSEGRFADRRSSQVLSVRSTRLTTPPTRPVDLLTYMHRLAPLASRFATLAGPVSSGGSAEVDRSTLSSSAAPAPGSRPGARRAEPTSAGGNPALTCLAGLMSPRSHLWVRTRSHSMASAAASSRSTSDSPRRVVPSKVEPMSTNAGEDAVTAAMFRRATCRSTEAWNWSGATASSCRSKAQTTRHSCLLFLSTGTLWGSGRQPRLGQQVFGCSTSVQLTKCVHRSARPQYTAPKSGADHDMPRLGINHRTRREHAARGVRPNSRHARWGCLVRPHAHDRRNAERRAAYLIDY